MPRVQKSAAADAASSSASAAVSASSGRQQKQGAQVCMALGIEVRERAACHTSLRAAQHAISTVLFADIVCCGRVCLFLLRSPLRSHSALTSSQPSLPSSPSRLSPRCPGSLQCLWSISLSRCCTLMRRLRDQANNSSSSSRSRNPNSRALLALELRREHRRSRGRMQPLQRHQLRARRHRQARNLQPRLLLRLLLLLLQPLPLVLSQSSAWSPRRSVARNRRWSSSSSERRRRRVRARCQQISCAHCLKQRSEVLDGRGPNHLARFRSRPLLFAVQSCWHAVHYGKTFDCVLRVC